LAGTGRKRRNNLEIIASILDACRYWTKKKNAMCQCGMSSKQFAVYLDVLLEANLLSTENNCQSPVLRVSSKGKDFLQAYNSMKTMME
jgi:predicted transcriptional regulator